MQNIIELNRRFEMLQMVQDIYNDDLNKMYASNPQLETAAQYLTKKCPHIANWISEKLTGNTKLLMIINEPGQSFRSPVATERAGMFGCFKRLS